MSETFEGLRNKLLNWKAFESNGLKVNLGKTKVMVSGGITKDEMCKSNIYPCEVCSLTAKANSVLCLQCGKWIHGRCAGVKMLTAKLSRNCLKKMSREYWIGSGGGRKAMRCSGNSVAIHISWC